MKFDPDRFTILKYFSYPCTVVNRTVTYEERGIGGTRGDKSVKEFFEAVLAKARKITGRDLMDNKIAFKVIDNNTKSTFYIGYKDGIYCFGSELNPYMNSAYTIDLYNYVKK